MPSLVETFVAHAPHFAADADAALEAALLAAIQQIATALPKIQGDPHVFVAHLAKNLPEDTPPLEGLTRIHVVDLALASYALAGNRAAQNELGGRTLARIPLFVARIDRSPSFADEVRQELSKKLLLPSEDGPPKLVSYTGRGPLEAWVRVAALRVAQNMKRGKASQSMDEVGEHLAAPTEDPELRLLKKRYSAEFTDAFRTVLVGLEPDERNVLRLHYIDGLSIDQVGQAYQVSRATAARWLASARQKIVEETMRRLRERLGQSAPNAQSLLSLVKSQLDVSLFKVLK
jgi:RNA polymerase sigma-70 factor (ECF subfamily)